MGRNNRQSDRVQFHRAYPAKVMGVDGTWHRPCELHDVSSTGARITIEGTTDVLTAREFFLVLSSNGLAFRRCEMVWLAAQPLASVSLKRLCRRRLGRVDGPSQPFGRPTQPAPRLHTIRPIYRLGDAVRSHGTRSAFSEGRSFYPLHVGWWTDLTCAGAANQFDAPRSIDMAQRTRRRRWVFLGLMS
jgi:hypothetical protein